MVRRRIALALFALLATAACTRADDPRGAATHSDRRERAPVPAERPAPPPEPELPPREVRFETGDGVTIAATLYPAAGPDAPVAILVHQLGSSRAEWEPLIARLRQRPAFALLAIDLRGHGESTAGPRGATLAWRELDNGALAQTAEDVLAAIRWVRSEDSPARTGRIALVGASIGSSAAIAAAARSEEVHAVVALSPGRAYRGFDAITPALELAGRPFFAAVAEQEPDSVETARAMGRITSSEPLVVSGSAHGVALFAAHPEVLDGVEEFLRRAMSAERAG